MHLTRRYGIWQVTNMMGGDMTQTDLMNRPDYVKECEEVRHDMKLFGTSWPIAIYYDDELDDFTHGPPGGDLGIEVGDPICPS